MYLIRFGIMSWIPTYLRDEKGFDPNQAKWLIGMFELAAVPGVIILGMVSDFLKGRRALVSLACVVGLAGCLFVYFTTMNHTYIIIALFIMGTLIYAPLTLVGLMVNEAVPKFAVGSSTGFMGFFQYMVGETLATALIGILVSIYGWQASNYVLFTAAAAAVLLLTFLSMNERKVIAREEQDAVH
jgi:OPA family glycerol-3-phosphate transporter-like MFS transporter